jgi:hypothetical protein
MVLAITGTELISWWPQTAWHGRQRRANSHSLDKCVCNVKCQAFGGHTHSRATKLVYSVAIPNIHLLPPSTPSWLRLNIRPHVQYHLHLGPESMLAQD